MDPWLATIAFLVIGKCVAVYGWMKHMVLSKTLSDELRYSEERRKYAEAHLEHVRQQRDTLREQLSEAHIGIEVLNEPSEEDARSMYVAVRTHARREPGAWAHARIDGPFWGNPEKPTPSAPQAPAPPRHHRMINTEIP